ncbi:MAG: CHAT domain-containing protein [Cyanobacteriota bacterium]|nr:CHAT domain-containing protein [Cyanobacteriota bacterium]
MMESGYRIGKRWQWFPLTVLVAGFLSTPRVRAQPITPARDGTRTTVTPSGDDFLIEGGQISGDGENLFHSFDRFGLEAGQSATFLANPQLENILGRVTGGDASIINGLLQVSGGNANLFLMNPAGIVFGSSATLNVPGDFTATTATGIGFGNGNGFDALGNPNWEVLVGAPTGFYFATNFATANVGAIANFGTLGIPPGGQLSLIGGSVLNVGILNAPGGNVTVAAIPGGRWVRLNRPGSLLDLEVAIDPQMQPVPGIEAIDPLSLPQLLAGGGDLAEASQIAVNPDGTLSLVAADAPIPSQPGEVTISGTIDVSNDASGFLPSTGPTPTIQILGDRVSLLHAQLDASGIEGGGNIFIGGDFGGGGTLPNARYTFIDRETSIFADAGERGNGGRVIVWADDTTQFLGTIRARGATFSTSNILSTDTPFPNSNGGFVEVSGRQHLIFDGTVDVSAASGSWGTLLLDPENIFISRTLEEETDFDSDPFSDAVPNLTVLDAAILENQAAQVILEATDDITIAPGVSLSFVPDGGAIALIADADNDAVGSFSMDAADSIVAPDRHLEISGVEIAAGTIDTSSLTGDGGSISLTSSGGDITTGDLVSQAADRAGAIELRTATGDITTGDLNAASTGGDGGAIDLMAQGGNIFLADLVTTGANNGGNVDIVSGGAIEIAGGILSFAGNNGGDITLAAAGNITQGELNSTPILLSGFQGRGGNFFVTSDASIELFGAVLTSAMDVGGDVTIRGGETVAIEQIIASSRSSLGGKIQLDSSEEIILLGDLETNQNSIVFNAPITLTTDVSIEVIDAREFENAIEIGDTVNGAYDLSLISDGGIVELSGAIGEELPLLSLEVRGEVNGDNSPIEIHTIGDISLQNITAENGIILDSDSGNIFANILDTSSLENSGNILLNARNINLSQINSQSGEGVGGDIEITATHFFQATDVFIDENGTAASISSRGALGGGSIVIRHGGGGIVPFTVGSATPNGTAGAISRGIEAEQTLTPTADYLFTQSQDFDRLQIVSVPESATDPTTPNQPIEIDTPNPDIDLPVTSDDGEEFVADNPEIPPQIPTEESNSETPNREQVEENEGDLEVLDLFEDIESDDDSPLPPPDFGNDAPPATPEVPNADSPPLETPSEPTADREPDLVLEAESSELAIALDVAPNIDPPEPPNVEPAGQMEFDPIANAAPDAQTHIELNAELDAEPEPESIAALHLMLAREIAQLLNGQFSIASHTDDRTFSLIWTIPEADRVISFQMPYADIPKAQVQVVLTNDIPSLQRETATPSTVPSQPPLEAEPIGNNRQRATSSRTRTDGSTVSSQSPRNPITPDRPPTEAVPSAIHPDEPRSPQRDASSAESPTQQPISSDRANTSPPENPTQVASDRISRIDIAENLAMGNVEEAIAQTDKLFASEFETHFETHFEGQLGERSEEELETTAETIRSALNTIETQTGKKSAIVYGLTLPESESRGSGEQLTLVLVVPEGEAIVKTIDLQHHRLHQTIRTFLYYLNSPQSDSYLPLAQELYYWLVQPLEEHLESLGIDTLIFSMDAGLRQIPLAALHDGRQFLVERYSLGSIPSLSLTDTRYKTIRDARVLAMGASEFPHADRPPLPAVPWELSILIGDLVRDVSGEADSGSKSDRPPESFAHPGLWPGLALIDEAFTLENLIAYRQEQTFSIVHLATHAQFDPTRGHEAYIQFWDDRLSLDGLRQARWYAPPVVELLVLSACETAVGNEYAELGFAGLAVRSGAKSALASLWKVSDIGSLVLMSAFYRHLKDAPIKAEALRRSQLEMLRGEVVVEGGQLAIAPDIRVPLPPELGNWDGRDFSHPYYWAGFTMVGSPW